MRWSRLGAAILLMAGVCLAQSLDFEVASVRQSQARWCRSAHGLAHCRRQSIGCLPRDRGAGQKREIRSKAPGLESLAPEEIEINGLPVAEM